MMNLSNQMITDEGQPCEEEAQPGTADYVERIMHAQGDPPQAEGECRGAGKRQYRGGQPKRERKDKRQKPHSHGVTAGVGGIPGIFGLGHRYAGQRFERSRALNFAFDSPFNDSG